jgi:hypothetical protein
VDIETFVIPVLKVVYNYTLFFRFPVFKLTKSPGEGKCVREKSTCLSEFSFRDDQAQTITAGMPA